MARPAPTLTSKLVVPIERHTGTAPSAGRHTGVDKKNRTRASLQADTEGHVRLIAAHSRAQATGSVSLSVLPGQPTDQRHPVIYSEVHLGL